MTHGFTGKKVPHCDLQKMLKTINHKSWFTLPFSQLNMHRAILGVVCVGYIEVDSKYEIKSSVMTLQQQNVLAVTRHFLSHPFTRKEFPI